MKIEKRPSIIKDECGTRLIYPDHYSVVVVQNLTERDNIPCSLRQNGMVAIIVEEGYTEYQITVLGGESLCDNTKWVRKTGEGPSSHPIYVAGEGVEIDYTQPFNPVINVDVLPPIFSDNISDI